MPTKKPVDPTRQNVTTILRHLRPKLPKGFQKTKEPGYNYQTDTVRIELIYYCQWQQAPKRKQRDCHPTMIKVIPRYGHHTLSQRTYKPRKDGHFNYEAIAATATELAGKISELERQADEEQRQRDECYDRRAKIRRRLIRHSPLTQKNWTHHHDARKRPYIYTRSRTLPNGLSISADVEVLHDEGGFLDRVSITIGQLTPDQAAGILNMAKTLKGCATKKASE